MSWGELGCKYFGNCEHEPTILTCNKNCPHYKALAKEGE
jgi:hypothetical protein